MKNKVKRKNPTTTTTTTNFTKNRNKQKTEAVKFWLFKGISQVYTLFVFVFFFLNLIEFDVRFVKTIEEPIRQLRLKINEI